MNRPMNQPAFFIAGNSKSGTTALHAFLKQHPAIFMSVPKEPNFFAKDFCRDPNPENSFYPITLSQYLDLFTKAQSGQICGEASACYLYSSVAAEEIYKFNPKAKILVILREPVDFLRSYHLQSLKNLPTEAETIKEFKHALDLEPSRKLGKNLPPKCLIPEFLYYRERVKYVEHLKRFYEYFREEQIKVIIYDDWIQDNQGIYKDVLEFLDVRSDFEPSFSSYNKGGVVLRAKWLQEIIHNLSHGKNGFQWLKRFTKIIFPDTIRKKLLTLIYQKAVFTQADALDPMLITTLKKEFKHEVITLSHFINRDLVEIWNYHNI